MGECGDDLVSLNGMDNTRLCCTTNTSPFDYMGNTPSSPISLIHSETDSNDVQLCTKNYEEAMSARPQKMDPAHLWHFVELMVEMKDNGELTSNSFRQEQFEAVGDKLFDLYRVRFSHQFLRKKFNNLRTDWKNYRWMKGFSGVSVEPRTGALNADEEQWANWLRRNGSVGKFRKQAPPCYDELTKLFKDNTAIGDINIEQGQAPADSDEEREMENRFYNQGSASMSWQQCASPPAQAVQIGQGSGVADVGGSSRRAGKRPVASGGADSGRSSKKSREESIGMALECWAHGQLVKQGNAEDNVSLAESMGILNAMGIADDAVYFKAINFLREPMNRVIFKLTDPGRRLALLLHST